MDVVREELPAAVHTVLRRWHSGQQEEQPWRVPPPIVLETSEFLAAVFKRKIIITASGARVKA
jgi:hypothetical protein